MKNTIVRIGIVAALLAAAHFARPAGHTEAAAQSMWVAQECSTVPGRVKVTFGWSGNDPGAALQYLDLSQSNNGWAGGTFLAAGPLASTQTSLLWDGLAPNTTHYVRVNQQYGNGGWDPSPTFILQTDSACPAGAPGTGGTGSTFVSSNAICQRGSLEVSVTANATGTLQLTRVRITNNGNPILNVAVSGQSYTNTITVPAGGAAQNLVVTAEDSSGQPPATATLTPICV